MSNIIQYKASYGNHSIDYIDSLPSTAIPLRTCKGLKLAPNYWYDSELQRIIRRNSTKAYHPFRYLRGNDISLRLTDNHFIHIKLQELINSIEECFPSPEEIEDMFLINSI